MAIFSIALALATAQSPQNAVNLSLYHVNQGNYSGITNMNTADGPGDAFFDMGLTPLSKAECANASHNPPPPPSPWPSHHTHHGSCSNPEEFANNLVISKVVVEVDSDFGQYGECNVCVNSTVPMTNPPEPCVDGTYHCRCGSFGSKDVKCTPNVGEENIADLFGRFPTRPGSPATSYWMKNLVERTGGRWYSTFEAGECGSPLATGCYWRLVQTTKVINATCHSTSLRKQLETTGGPCFNACAQPLNTSSSCYLGCYYTTLLGPDAGTTFPSTGGLGGPAITSLWTDAFDGCPSL